MPCTIKMDRKLTRLFVDKHGRFMIAKAYFKFCGGRTYILQFAFITRGQVNNVFGRARQFLIYLVGSACGKAFKLGILN